MQCPLCQQENPASQKFCGECGTSLARPKSGWPATGEIWEYLIEGRLELLGDNV